MNRSSSRLADGLRAASLACLALTMLAKPAAAQSQNFAIALNGVDAFGTAAGVGGLVSNSTWEAWVKIPAVPVSSGCVLARWGMYSHALSINTATGQTSVDMCSCWSDVCPHTQSPPNCLMRNTWQHIALVYGPESGPSAKAFVDGELVAWCGPQGCTPYAGWETILGAWGYLGYSSFVHATIDEARISNIARYNTAFTPQSRFSNDSNTVGLWHFDEGQGATAFDSSGHGRHFALHGGFEWATGNTSTVAEFEPFGGGCLGSGGAPTLRVVELPRPGAVLAVAVDHLPQNYAAGYAIMGFSREHWGALALPMDLAFFGMPNCQLLVEPAMVGMLPLPPDEVRIEYLVPPNLGIIGAEFYLQALLMDPQVPDPANLLGGITSNAMAGVVGY